MNFTQESLRVHLAGLGIPAYGWQLPDDIFGTVEDDHLPAVWAAWMASLKKNAPQCVAIREMGGGKRREVPRWQAEGGDCDNHSVLMWAHFLQGEWMSVVAGGPAVGRTAGIVFYDAIATPENYLVENGPHATMWCLTHIDANPVPTFKLFEPSMGLYIPWTPAEAMSAWFGCCA